ncbi:hypothetical protein D3C81_1784760 [compost metagenome]
MHHIHAICQRESHAFQHCFRQFCRPMLMRQTKKDAFRLRIIMRRTFTRQVRQKPDGFSLLIRLLCRSY